MPGVPPPLLPTTGPPIGTPPGDTGGLFRADVDILPRLAVFPFPLKNELRFLILPPSPANITPPSTAIRIASSALVERPRKSRPFFAISPNPRNSVCLAFVTSSCFWKPSFISASERTFCAMSFTSSGTPCVAFLNAPSSSLLMSATSTSLPFMLTNALPSLIVAAFVIISSNASSPDQRPPVIFWIAFFFALVCVISRRFP